MTDKTVLLSLTRKWMMSRGIRNIYRIGEIFRNIQEGKMKGSLLEEIVEIGLVKEEETKEIENKEIIEIRGEIIKVEIGLKRGRIHQGFSNQKMKKCRVRISNNKNPKKP